MKTKALLCILFFVSLSLHTKAQGGFFIKASADSSIYTFGRIEGAITFDNGETIGDPFNYEGILFIASYDTDGTVEWAKAIQSSYYSYPGSAGLEVDKEDNIYLAGAFADSIAFDSSHYLLSASLQRPDYAETVFIAKLDTEGDFLWGDRPIGSTYSRVLGMDTDSLDNVYIMGSYQGPAFSFGDLAPLAPTGSTGSTFVAKFNSEGTPIWLRDLGMQANAHPFFSVKDFKVDAAGNQYFTGIFTGNKEGSLTFGNLSLIGADGYYEIFLAKSDTSGNPLWLTKIQTEGGSDNPQEIVINQEGDVYLTGLFSFNSIFGDSLTVSANLEDFFLAQFDSLGTFQWVRQASPHSAVPIYMKSYGLELNQEGDIYSIGQFYPTISFPPLPTISLTESEGFLVKHDNTGQALCVANVNQKFNGLSIDKHGNVFTMTYNGHIWRQQLPQIIVSKWDTNCNNLWDNYADVYSIGNISDPLPESFAKTYPNPATNTLNIELTEMLTRAASLELYEMSGKLILREQLTAGTRNKKLDISIEESGLYLLRIITEDGTLNRKIIKM